MASTAEQNKLKLAFKFLLAVLICILLVLFFNKPSYNYIRGIFDKSSKVYLDMYAYSKSKPKFEKKYFIIQGNASEKSVFNGEVEGVEEGELDKVDCSSEETIFIYKKPTAKIDDFIKKRQGQELILNKGTEIEFYTAKIIGTPSSCRK